MKSLILIKRNRSGFQIIKNISKKLNYKLGFFLDTNNIYEMHNLLNFTHKESSFNLIFSFIDSDDNIIGLNGTEAFSFGDENLNHIFGFDYVKSVNDKTKFLFEYRHLKAMKVIIT